MSDLLEKYQLNTSWILRNPLKDCVCYVWFETVPGTKASSNSFPVEFTPWKRSTKLKSLCVQRRTHFGISPKICRQSKKRSMPENGKDERSERGRELKQQSLANTHLIDEIRLILDHFRCNMMPRWWPIWLLPSHNKTTGFLSIGVTQ